MSPEEKDLLKIYLEEIKYIASTKRIGKVLVSHQRALDEIFSYADEAIKVCLGND